MWLSSRGLLERRRLDVRYYAMSRDEETRRQSDPYYLTVYEGGVYLVGYCHLRKTERIFSVERVRELKVLATRFTVRPGFNAQAEVVEPQSLREALRLEIAAVAAMLAPRCRPLAAVRSSRRVRSVEARS